MSHSQTLAGLKSGTKYYYRVNSRDRAGNMIRSKNFTFRTSGTPSATSYISDLDWVSAANGNGPVEKDRSSGGSASGDGRPLKINDKTYSKGLGVAARSDVRFKLDRKCTVFQADIGIDEEVGSKGSVAFQVWADGQKLYESSITTGRTETKTISVDLAGKNEMQLVVTDGGNGNSKDRADWADARITCFS